MNTFLKKIPHYGDIIAIPFFFLMTLYFFQIEERNFMENVFMVLCFGAMLADMLFTYLYLG